MKIHTITVPLRRLTAMLLVICLVFSWGFLSVPARADTVNETVDTAAALQEAIDTAVARPSQAAPYVIEISDDFTLTAALTVTGGANITFVSGKTGGVTVCAAEDYRHIWVYDDSGEWDALEADVTLTFEGVTLDGGCGAEGDNDSGGGIDAWLGAGYALTLNGAVIKNCYNGAGGGVYVYGGSLALNDCKITTNTAENGGGGVYAESCSLALNSGEISGNNATLGGGIYAYGCGYYAYYANEGGYEYEGSADCSIKITGGSIYDNIASNDGGGIYVEYSRFEMSAGEIKDNTAYYDGGGIYGNYCGKGSYSYEYEDYERSSTYDNYIKITGGSIYDNIASDDGGGIYLESSRFEMSAGSITYNTADDDGGGICARGCGDGWRYYMSAFSDSDELIDSLDDSGDFADNYIKISGGSIDNNDSGYWGGGIYVEYSRFEMSGGEIKDNTAYYDGGGIYAYGCVYSAIYWNYVDDEPLVVTSLSELEYDYSNITDNYIKITGGAVTGNEAEVLDGGGVYLDYSRLDMSGGSIDNNTAGDEGGGIYGYYCGFYGRYGSYGNYYQTYDSAISISGGAVTGNYAADDGGGIYLDSSRLELSGGGSVDNNTAGNNGGGIYGDYCGFYEEFGNEKGGSESYSAFSASDYGYYNKYDGAIYIKGGAVTENYAHNDGGGIYANSDYTDDYWKSVSENEIRAAGIVDDAGEVQIGIDSYVCMTGGEVTYNGAGNNGGGIYADAHEISPRSLDADDAEEEAEEPIYKYNLVEITGGRVSNNAAGVVPEGVENTPGEGNGGGIYLMAAAELIIGESGKTTPNVLITYNAAANEGGGIYTEAYEDYADLNEYDYQNITAYGNTAFSGNTAKAAYRPPVITESYENIAYASSSILDGSKYIHPINNYDINYVGEEALDLYTVIYHANGGTGANGDSRTVFLVLGTGHTVLSSADAGFTRPGSYTFRGWSTASSGSVEYTAGRTLASPEEPKTEINLYAMWRYDGGGTTLDPSPSPSPSPEQYTVIYDANGGANADGNTSHSVSVAAGDAHTVLSNSASNLGFKRAGYAFRGWSETRDAANPTYFGIDGGTIGASAEGGDTITLYAIWSRVFIPDEEFDIDDEDVPLAFLDIENHFAYIIGYEDGTVRPQGNITRGEVATIFFRLLTQESRAELWSNENKFTDVKAGDWYNNAISTLAYGRILSGYQDGTFRPNGAITRAEFAAIAARFATEEDLAGATGDAVFTDISGHWAEDHIVLAAALGYISGYPDGSFRPGEPITRAEVASLLNKVLGRSVESKDDLLLAMVTWPDNTASDAWYYFDVQEATNSHFYDRKEDGVNEIWTEIRPIPDWTVLQAPDAEAGDIRY